MICFVCRNTLTIASRPCGCRRDICSEECQKQLRRMINSGVCSSHKSKKPRPEGLDQRIRRYRMLVSQEIELPLYWKGNQDGANHDRRSH